MSAFAAKFNVEFDNVWGFQWALEKARLSHGSQSDSVGLKNDALGVEDWHLAKKLVRAGDSHSKFMRCITVWMTITAPRYWWQQWDTYTFKEELSESTMHTIMDERLYHDDFVAGLPTEWLDYLNKLIERGQFERVKALLPEGFMQTRGVITNYQTLRTVYHQRINHRLWEWQEFCRSLCRLPYGYLIISRRD